MDIFALGEAIIQLLGCFLEVFALSSGAGAGVVGYQARKRTEAERGRGDEAPRRNPYRVWFVVLVLLAVFFSGLVAFKWLAGVK
ncbi:MAG: hypothetical protein U0793_04645 [Gemmataceae bacterium]